MAARNPAGSWTASASATAMAMSGWCRNFHTPLRAPSFHKQHVAPSASQVAQPLASPHQPETGSAMQFDAGRVLREDTSLQGPESLFFGPGHERASGALGPGPDFQGCCKTTVARIETAA
jgi:hypothetical protein